MGNIMTNPTKKFTKEQFIEKAKKSNPSIELLIEDYKGVDYRYKYQCTHGINEIYGWQLIKPKKHCCVKGYHEKRIPPLTKSIHDRVKQIKKTWGEKYDISNARFDPNDRRKIILKCFKHGEFSQWTGSLTRQGVVDHACPECSKEKESLRKKEQALDNFHRNGNHPQFISNQETSWLDELGVKERQVFLEDIKYKVDGYDAATKTVYLFHGKFWHGCPNTYDPEEQHPILKIKMGELYEKTLHWEEKIKCAGYNLVTKWG